MDGVGYIKVRQLYRFLSPSAHVFFFILCIIGVVDLFYYFYACAGCSIFRAHFCSGLVSKGQLQIIVVDSKRYREPREVMK